MKKIATLLFVIFIFSSLALSQDESKPVNMKGRHILSLNFGSKTNSENEIDINFLHVGINSGFSGSFSYGYWFNKEFAMNFQIGVLGVKSNTSFHIVSSESVVPLLFGIRYYPLPFALGEVGRPYGGINIGSYHKTFTSVNGWLSTNIRDESVFGMNFQIGVDLFLGDWLKIGPGISYHVIGKSSHDFDNNTGGMEYSLSFGLVF